MKKKLSLRSVLNAWLITYVFILLLPLPVNLFLYSHSRNILESGIQDVRRAMLTQLKNNVDASLVSMKQNALILSQNVQFMSVLNADRKNTISREKYKVLELVNFLNLLGAGNPNVDEITVFFKNSKSVFSQGTYVTSDFYYSHYVDREDYEQYDTWEKFITEKHDKPFIVSTLYSNSNLEKHVSYAFSAPPYGLSDTQANILISMSHSKLLSMLNNYRFLDQGNVLIINSDNRIVASTSPVELRENIQYESLVSDKVMYFSDENDRAYAALSTPSIATDWKYVILTDTNLLYEKLAKYSQIAMLLNALYTIFGLVLVFFLAKRNYKPIQKIVNLVSDKTPLGNGPSGNEYRYLQNAFETAFFRLDEMQLKIDQQSDIIRRNFFNQLLNGKEFDPDQLNDALDKYDIHFREKFFSVFIVNVDVSSRGTDVNRNIPMIKIAEYFRVLKVEHLHLFYVVEGNYIVFIANGDHTAQEQLNHDLYDWVAQLKGELEALTPTSIAVAVSNEHDSIFGISEAYHEALGAMDYIQMYAPDEIIFYNMIQQKSAYYFPINIEQKIMNNIRAGDREEVAILLKEVLDQNLQHMAVVTKMKKSLFLDVAGCIVKATDGECSEMMEYERLLNSVMTGKKLKEIVGDLDNLLDVVCIQQKVKNEKAASTSYRSAIETYIDAHFPNVDLNLSTMAEHFGLTPSYLSKLYKNETGEGIVHQINQVRMTHAKKLLTETELSIMEITERVGILHDTSFNRLFKNSEGITPGQYRKSNSHLPQNADQHL